MIWIDAKDLEHWADKSESEALLPALIRRLVTATTPQVALSKIPSGSSISNPGWDGRIEADSGHAFVPRGVSVWEVSRRKDVASKANEDYEKRTRKSLGENPAAATYIFVTLHVWNGKEAWANARVAAGPWKSVRVYDASDLAQWIELAPAVGAWLAREIGKLPSTGILSADEFWEDWVSSTEPQIRPALVLAGRAEQASQTLAWLNGPPDQFYIRGETRDEAIAFVIANVFNTGEFEPERLLSHCVIARTAEAWRALSQHPVPLIIVTDLPEQISPSVATRRGHHVLTPIGRGEDENGRGCALPRLGREEIIVALKEMGFTQDQGRALAGATARSMPVVRRWLIASAGGRKPFWADPPAALSLLPALLIGQWSENQSDDTKALSEVADRAYPEIATEYALLLNRPDAPLRKIGSNWRLTSHEEAWELLAPALTKHYFDRFRIVVQAVLGSELPELELPPDERHLAGLRGKTLPYSGAIREGLATSLALMGSRPDRAVNVANVDEIATSIVREILSHPERWKMWASIGWLLPTLAEAAPEAFLERVEEALAATPSPFLDLFKEDGDGMFGSCHHAGLLWALERVAWSPDYFSRVAFILARLAEIDPGGRWSNRPGATLRTLFLPWIRFSATSDSRRLYVIDELLARVPTQAWHCLISAGPQSHDTVTHRTPPEFREWGQGSKQPTVAEHEMFVAALTERIVEGAGDSAERWRNIVGVVGNFSPEHRKRALALLENATAKLRDQAGAVALWHKLRSVVGHHREFPEAHWAMPVEDTDRLAAVYEQLTPVDLIVSSEWMFDSWPRLIDGESPTDYEQRTRKLDGLRSKALQEIASNCGTDGIIALAERAKAPWTVGALAPTIIQPNTNLLALIIPYLAHENRPLRVFSRAACEALFRRDGWNALEECLVAVRGTPDETLKTSAIYLAAPAVLTTWKRLEQEPTAIQTAYWRALGDYRPLFPDSQEELNYQIDHLIVVGRPLGVIYSLAHDAKPVSTDLIVRALEAAPAAIHELAERAQTPMVTGYEFAKVFGRLDSSSDVPRSVIAQLEIPFVGILEHSRPNLALHREVAANPATFADVISWAYKRSDGTIEDEQLSDNQRHNRARIAWDLLHHSRTLPGQQRDGSIDAEALKEWIKQSRQLCQGRTRGDIADEVIGQILSSAPVGQDGVWPCEPVRDVLDEIRSKYMGRGFIIGKMNLRGVTTRNPFEGGSQERDLARTFRQYAEQLADRRPFTAQQLRSLASSYEEQARREDNESDWRDT